MKICLDGYGSKIRKVSRCRPTVSNEIILATKHEFFFAKVVPVQNINAIAFLIYTVPLNIYFTDTTIYFFLKNFFSEWLYFSEYDIWMFLFVFWLRNKPSIKFVRNWGNDWVWEGGTIQNVYTCVHGRVEKQVISKIRTYQMDGPKQMLWKFLCGFFKIFCRLFYLMR